MRNALNIIGLLLLWLFVAGFVIIFHKRSQEHRAVTTVQRIEVVLADSLPDENMLSRELVNGWIKQSKIPVIGVPIADVDVVGVEALIRRNGFVAAANAGITHDGVMHIEVSQRKPLLRLIVDGYNCYVTKEGFVFPAPKKSSVYVPVVTGEYKPLFERDYVGLIEDHIEQLIKESNERILALQHDKKPFFDREEEIRDSIREVRRMKVDRKGVIRYRGWGESDESYKNRIIAKQKEKAVHYRRYRYWRRQNDKKIADLTSRQDLEYRKQKKLMKRYEDFTKLINFVEYIGEDSFWSHEIVQIVASTMSNGELELELIPRSGNHRVLFGQVGDEEEIEEKLDRLLAFYENGLRNLGWDTFRSISVKYRGQVVCSK